MEQGVMNRNATQPSEGLKRDLSGTLDDAEELVRMTADQAGEQVAAARTRIKQSLSQARQELSRSAGARRLAGQMAACLQGSLLVRFAPAEVADAFCGTRLGTSYAGTFGMLTSGGLRPIVDRATPTV